ILGLTESQLGLIDRLSTDMRNTLYTKMQDDGGFTEYSQVAASFDTAKAEIGESAIALDIINNKEKSAAKIIEILYEYEALLTGLNKTDYELLKDGENVYYQNQVKEKLLAGMPYSVISDVAISFNALVAEQKSAKETITTLRTADYTTIQTIIGNKHTELGISAAVYSDYQYIAGASSAKFTDLINTLLMYKGQYTDPGAFSAIFTREVSAVKNSLPSGSNPSPGPSSSGGNTGKNIGSSIGATTPSVNANNKNTLFTDLTSVQWAETQILYLADKGIVNGKGNNLFDPNGYVTREEFVKMIVTAFNIHNADAVSSFSDSDNSKWYDSYIASAADKGIVKGSDNGGFGVGQNITREDMSVLVYRILKSEKNFIAQLTDEVFDDNANISDYAAEGIYALKNAGYVSGVGNNLFKPKNYCTRAEAAVIIYNVIK
ncbi:MAG: S-layer homology domain-containing protein, partial [Clostridia bacterium]|nr:S-layer homology domain-containing protein [Clostridia bacterium]